MVKKQIEKEDDDDSEEPEEEEESEEEEKPVQKKSTESKASYQLGEVATQTTPVFINVKTQRTMNLQEAILELLNKVDKIENELV